MKQHVKCGFSLLIVLTLILSSMSIPTFALGSTDSAIFTVNGIRYRILDEDQKTVEVIHSTVDEAESNMPGSTYSGEVTIPAKVTNGSTEYSVIGIDNMAFGYARITGITLPEGLQYIDMLAFSDSSLASINIPASVTQLGKQVFEDGKITSIIFAKDSKLDEIGQGAFARCDKLETLEIPAGVKNLDGVLDNWANAKNVTFAEGSPFSKGSDGVLYNGNTLLKSLDKNITSVTVKDGTTTIGDNAFNLCRSLVSVTLPNGLETIGQQAFKQCENLESITLPDTVTKIGYEAFSICKKLTGIKLSDSLMEIGENAFYQTALVTVVIPDGIKEIPVEAFQKVATLRTIVIPSSVTSIGNKAFSGLKDGASGTTLIMQGATAPNFDAKAFGVEKGLAVSPTGLTVLVPSTAKSAYTEDGYILKDFVTDENLFGLTMIDPTVKAATTSENKSDPDVSNTKTFVAHVPDGCTLTVESSDPTIATAVVGEDGKTITITGVVKGKTTVTAKITLDSINYTLWETMSTVTVTENEIAVVVPSAEVAQAAEGVDVSDDSVGKQVLDALAPANESSTGITITDNGENNALTEAARELLAENTVSAKKEGIAALKNNDITVNDEDTVSIVIQPYLDVKLLSVSKAEDASSLKLEISPMYRTVATTANLDNNEGIVLDEGQNRNAAVVEEGKELSATGTTTVSIPLPSNFMNGTAYIKHTKGSRTYVYTGTISTDNVLTFVNPHGFSTFDITTENPIVASITQDEVTTSYASLQDAVDEVTNGGTITIVGNVEAATVRKTILFNVALAESVTTNFTTDSIEAGSHTTKRLQATNGNAPYTYSFVYTRPSSGGGGGSTVAATTYNISVPSSITHGSISLSKSSAAENDKVTLTVKADKGYTLEVLKATDANGREVALTAVELGKEYTFVMPASKVSFEVSFMDDNSILNYFVDVNAADYFYDAVLWAAEKEITTGMDDSHFAPKANCTRAQIVTFLWRAAGSPEVTTDKAFSDVASDSYYARAVAWAVANGITTGTEADKFSPDDTCTRAQSVTFLARALKGTAEASAEFSDVASDSYYASAVAWAKANGITKGVTDSTFGPDNDCTRAQIVTFLYRGYANK